ncbi:MAG: hypothetical protein A4S17_01065 [Proteobacteria bacterium HN_bin10]|nr:MAG: hypothetical protein A4S17_01065 [Proteobacteria bacterium HN_bin10]
MKRLILVAALALAACGQESAQQRESNEAYPVVGASDQSTTIGPDGAAGIGTALAMDVAAVQAAAPSYVVAEVDDQIEGEAFKAITLSAGNEEVFRINPTADRRHIHSIVTRSSQARSAAGEIVGQSKFAVAPPEQVSFCSNEIFDGSAGFACSSAQDGRFWRVYRLPEGASEAESFEDIEPDLLHDATLVEMRWIAPRV